MGKPDLKASLGETEDETTRLVLAAISAGVTDVDAENILERLNMLHDLGMLSDEAEEVRQGTLHMVRPYS